MLREPRKSKLHKAPTTLWAGKPKGGGGITCPQRRGHPALRCLMKGWGVMARGELRRGGCNLILLELSSWVFWAAIHTPEGVTHSCWVCPKNLDSGPSCPNQREVNQTRELEALLSSSLLIFHQHLPLGDTHSQLGRGLAKQRLQISNHSIPERSVEAWN